MMTSEGKTQGFRDSFSGRRVLVTGHTGFKGSWLTAWLLRLGAQVAGYARDPLPHETLFDVSGLASRLSRDVRGDLSDLAELSHLVRDFQPDFVFHLAAQPLVRLSYEIPVETFSTNVMGTVNVLEALRGIGTKHSVTTVMVTTDKCYENKEWLGAYREDDAMGGYDPYSASKGCAELVTSAYRRSFFGGTGEESPVRLASARAGNVIGGGDWAVDRIVPDIFRAVQAGHPVPVRNKIATRPWQHVLEPLSGYLWLAALLGSSTSSQQDNLLRSAFNFGPNLTSNRTVAQLVEELLKHTGGNWVDETDPHALHEASKLNLAIDKSFHLLGWQPVWDFEATIERTAAWYLRHAAGENAAALCDEQIGAYCAAASDKGLSWAQ